MFLFFGMFIQRYGVIGNIIIPYFSKKNLEFKNFLMSSDLELLSLNISFKNYQKLMKIRQDALSSKSRILINKKEYVSASLEHNKKEVQIGIRLKGDLSDHFSNEEKLSFRIIVKDDETVLGMDKFSIQHPRTRNWLGEWIFHKAAKDQGIVSLKYDFVRVRLNGKDLGIYAIEEHFTNIMLENNNRRPGPIIKYSERFYWDQINKYNIWSNPLSSGYGGFYSSEIGAFNNKQIAADTVLSLQFQNASRLLSDFRNGLKTTKETFDIERLSSLFALNDLFQAHHGARWNNIRLYYNPINNVLEPISFDAQTGFIGTFLACNPRYDLITSYTPYFEDEDFYKLYMSKLKKYGNILFFQSVLDRHNKDLDKFITILKSEWPDYEFDYNSIYENINFIRSILKPGKFISSQLIISKKDINISVGNMQILPLTNLHLKFPDNSKIALKDNFILHGKKQNQLLKHEKFLLDIPDFGHNNWHENLKLGFQVIGIDSTIYEDLTSINIKKDKFFTDSANNNLNFNDLDFISEIFETNEIIFKSGSHTIDKDIFIPENKLMIISKGTKLDFIDNSYIYSRSPFLVIGDIDSPIELFSSDSSGGGILLDRVQGVSYFEYVSINNFGARQNNQRSLTGVLTANESPIELKDCNFIFNKSEDALNIIRSNFKLENCTFMKNHNDAIDLDFSNGSIIDSYFFKSGNDAIDCSGSEIYLKNIIINYAIDKAISAGELTKIEGANLKIINSNIGLVAKDKSHVIINQVSISKTDVAIAIFQKKNQFGPAKMKILNGTVDNCKKEFLIEKKSTLIFNDVKKRPNSNNLRNTLYN